MLDAIFLMNQPKIASRTEAATSSLAILSRRLPPFHRAWEQVFRLSKLPVCEIAVELCCGQSPKIGVALHQSSLANQVGYIDANHSALLTCKAIVENLSPGSSSFFLNSSLETLEYDSSFDLIAGNHILDDLFLQHYLEHVDESCVNAYETRQNFISLVNQVVPYYSDNADGFLSTLASHFDRLVSNNGRIILSDYVSYYEQRYSIVEWPLLRFALTDKLSQHLLSKGFRAITIHPIPSIFSRVHIWEKGC